MKEERIIDELTQERIRKFGKEDMTLEDFAVFVSLERGLGSDGLNKRTISNYLEELCELSGNKITLDDFKDKNNEGKLKGTPVYKLKPELHGVLASLMCSNFFDGRRGKKRLLNIEESRKEIYENCGKYLDSEDLEICKKYSPYLNESMEQALGERIDNQIKWALMDLYKIDSLDRYQYMLEFLEMIVEFRKKVNSRPGLFVNNNRFALEKFLINMLWLKMECLKPPKDNKLMQNLKDLPETADPNYYKSQYNDESIFPLAIRLIELMYNVEGTYKDAGKELVNEMDKRINQCEHFNEIMDKVSNVLDFFNPVERRIYYKFMAISRAECYAYNLQPGYWEKMPYYIEQVTKYREKILEKIQEQDDIIQKDFVSVKELFEEYKVSAKY